MSHSALAFLIPLLLLQRAVAIVATSQSSPRTATRRSLPQESDSPSDLLDPPLDQLPLLARFRAASPKIPMQLVLTAEEGSISDLPEKMHENLRQTLKLNPGMTVQFLNDSSCGEFIGRHFGAELASAFSNETKGAYRGDICRAAVIAIEGGFYADLDVQFRAPLGHLVDNTTTFMTSFDASCNILNAVFAAEPRSEVMRSVMEFIKDWYRFNRVEHGAGWMGTTTMRDGLEKVMKHDCPWINLRTSKRFQFACGRRQTLRLYREKPLKCDAPGSAECPPGRADGFGGLRYGIFEPGPERNLVAWSRFDACTKFGCDERRVEAICNKNV